MTDWHSYSPAEGHRLPHDPLNAIVAPRPIGWIGTRSAAGVFNLAPYSFFNLFNYRPPIIGFSSTGRKHSVANIAETGVFTWNLVTRDLAEAMNATSTAAEVDEFAAAGLEPLASLAVDAPRVARSPVQFECRHTQTVQLQSADGRALDQWMVFGEAVFIHIDPALLEGGIYQTARAHPVSRGGGPADYFETREDALFRMQRPD